MSFRSPECRAFCDRAYLIVMTCLVGVSILAIGVILSSTWELAQ